MFPLRIADVNLEQHPNKARIAQQVSKFMIFETNTASCDGFPGAPDPLINALWRLGYGLTVAHSNFARALRYIGGRNVYYNVSWFLFEVIKRHSLVCSLSPGAPKPDHLLPMDSQPMGTILKTVTYTSGPFVKVRCTTPSP